MTKDALLAELARSRAAVSRDYSAVRQEMDFAAKAERVIRRKPFAWLGGAAALGWILAGPRTRTRVVVRPAKGLPRGSAKAEPTAKSRFGLLAFLFGLLKLAAPLLRPVATTYATRLLAELAGRLGK